MPGSIAIRSPRAARDGDWWLHPGPVLGLLLLLTSVGSIVTGCLHSTSRRRPETPIEHVADSPAAKPAEPSAADTLRAHGRQAGAAGVFFALAAAATFIAGFIPVVGRFIPRKAAGAALVVSLGLWWLEYAILRYGVSVAEGIFWIGLAGAAIAAAPLAIAFYRYFLVRQGHALIRDGNVRDGIALTAAGDTHVNRERKVATRELFAYLKGGPDDPLTNHLSHLRLPLPHPDFTNHGRSSAPRSVVHSTPPDGTLTGVRP